MASYKGHSLADSQLMNYEPRWIKYAQFPSAAGLIPNAPYIPFAIDDVVMINGTPESSSAVGKAAPVTDSVNTTGRA